MAAKPPTVEAADVSNARQLNRRRFIQAGALAAGAALLPGASLRLARAAPILPSLVGHLNTQQLVSSGQLWDWQNFMVDLGPRFTGSPQHVAYLDFLEGECRKAGLTTFHDVTQRFPRWDADYTRCELGVVGHGGSLKPLDVMSYFPGSGNTSNLPG